MTKFSVGGTVVDDLTDVLLRLSPVIRGLIDDVSAEADTGSPMSRGIPLDCAVMSGNAQTLNDIILMADMIPTERPWDRTLAAYQSAHLLALEPAWLSTASRHVNYSAMRYSTTIPVEDLVPWTSLARIWPELRADTTVYSTLRTVYTCGYLNFLGRCRDPNNPVDIRVIDRLAHDFKGVLDACSTEDDMITFLVRTVRPDYFAKKSDVMRQMLTDTLVGRVDRKWDTVREYVIGALVCQGRCEDALRIAEAAEDTPRQYVRLAVIEEMLEKSG